jgi:hypothetical protein
MDQEEQQACVMPPEAAPVCAAPADGGADAAPAVAPAPGDASNPILAPVSAAALPPSPVSKEEKEAGDQLDAGGKAMDFIGTMAKAMKLPFGEAAEKAGGQIGGLASMPGDIMATASGIDEIRKGDKQNGVLDTGIGGAGIVADAASIAGNNPIANVANAVKGGLEIGKGGGQIIDAATAGPIAPGQSGIDRADEAVNGVENLLKGVGDGAQAFGPQAAAAGKALNYGMAAGNAIAPLVFGDMKESTGDMGRTADGVYHGTTGNSVIDWIAGVGKYSNGRLHDSSAPQ